jgi:UDP:flavonoid glycosyltransferase YjiC (YdhE family)
VVAELLELPRVASCAGHYVDPAAAIARYESDSITSAAPACHRAVEMLRDRYGIADASPVSYLTNLSPVLNLYGQPPQWLSPAQREQLEPVAFYGSLPSPAEIEARRTGGARAEVNGAPRIYAAFGAHIWHYWPETVLEAFSAVSEAVAEMPGASLVIGLGGAEFGAAAVATLSSSNVQVIPFVDQWRALSAADVFITHHGLYSTHEAIYSRVPMLGYPFSADQPALAASCAQRGLSVPLVQSPRDPLNPERVREAVSQVQANRAAMVARLEEAREWERELMAQRPNVVQKLTELLV